VTMYRGVLLYGDSCAGKSSLLNARFVPDAIADGFLPERIRVQPKSGAEIVVDRIAVRERGNPPFLPSNLGNEEQPRLVLSCEQLRERLSGTEVRGYPLLIFDQFEEFVTLFEIAPRSAEERAEGAEAQARLVNLLAEFLVASHAPVKILFAFREDYFTKLQKLFARCRDLMDQSVRLLPPSVDELPLTIRGPFEKNPGMFANPLSAGVCEQLEAELRERSSGGLQNPTEGQIAGLMLWLAQDRENLLASRKVQGLLEDFLVQQLEALPLAERAPAVALLGCLVTDAGTRNIVSRSDLLDRVTESESVTEEAVSTTLDALVEQTGLVRQEFRDRTAVYQIISEFLVPWIRDQKADRARIDAEQTLVRERLEAARKLAEERERAEQKLALQTAEADRRRAQDLATTLRKVRRSRTVLAVLTVLMLGGWTFAGWQTHLARHDKNVAVAAEEAAAQEKESAQLAENAARTALEQNSRLATNAEKRLLAAGRALNQIKQATQTVLENMRATDPPTDAVRFNGWNQLIQKLEAAVQLTENGGRQVASAIQLTKQEAAGTTSPPGWSLYGKLDVSSAWTEDRYFHNESSALAIPKEGDVVVAETFVNVRGAPSAYDAEQKSWRLAQIIGVIAPEQRIKVDEVTRVQGPTGAPTTRVWIRGEPAPWTSDARLFKRRAHRCLQQTCPMRVSFSRRRDEKEHLDSFDHLNRLKRRRNRALTEKRQLRRP
jgi:hypothetical protein